MLAGKVRCVSILLRSVTATLRITVATLVDAYRDRYSREASDRRLRWWSRRLLDLVEAKVRVVGDASAAKPAGRPLVIMSNHSSLYDIPLIFMTLPGSIRMLTKKELFRVPLWGRGMEMGEFVSIDRSNHGQAIRDLEQAKAKMTSGISLWVAPEGTRSRDGTLGDFKKGGFVLAIQTGALILPVGIRGSHDILPPKTFFEADLGCTAEVHVGEPIDAGSYAMERREELVARVRARIAELAAVEK
jgi:1-acyl-sn-glycerol-3-phosphate acyltransferase